MDYDDAVVSPHLPPDATSHEFPPMQDMTQDAASAAREFLGQASLDVAKDPDLSIVQMMERTARQEKREARRNRAQASLHVVESLQGQKIKVSSHVVEKKQHGGGLRRPCRKQGEKDLRNAMAVHVEPVPEPAKSKNREEVDDKESGHAYLLAAVNLLSQPLGQPAFEQKQTYTAPARAIEEPAPSLASLPQHFSHRFAQALSLLEAGPLIPERPLVLPPHNMCLCLRGLQPHLRKQGIFKAILGIFGYSEQRAQVACEYITGYGTSLWALLLTPPDDSALKLAPKKGKFCLRGHAPHSLKFFKTSGPRAQATTTEGGKAQTFVHRSGLREKTGKKIGKKKKNKILKNLRQERSDWQQNELLSKSPEVSARVEQDEAAGMALRGGGQDEGGRVEGQGGGDAVTNTRSMMTVGRYHQSHKSRKSFGKVMKDYEDYYAAINEERLKDSSRAGPESLPWVAASHPVKIIYDLLSSRDKWSMSMAVNGN